MRLKQYSSDLSAKGWQVIQKILFVQRKSKWDLHEVVNGIFYLTKNGCMWRDLPGEFPPWQTVYWYYRKWVKDGTWDNINRSLVVDNRIVNDRKSQPAAVIIDSQSSKNSSTCTENVGIDGGKLIKGRKRFYVTDTLGNLLDSFVVPANSYDGTTAAKHWNTMYLNNELLQNIHLIFADGTFGGTFRKEMEGKYNIGVEIPKVPIARKGKIEIHEKRWIVERTIAWTLNNRRCSKDYERKTKNANAFIVITSIRRLAGKI
jgi:putative transposase